MPIEYMRPEHRGDTNCCRCCSVTQSCLILCNCIDWNIQVCLFFTMSWSLLKFMSTESVMPFTHLVLCCPHLLLTSVFPCIRIFSTELAFCIRWPKYWSFSFSIIPSSEYSGLISFRIDWSDLLAVQGTPKNFLQHHSLKSSILQYSAFLMAHLSPLYMTTEKNHSFVWLTKDQPLSAEECPCFLILCLGLSYLFAFSHCTWGSQGRNAEVVCNSLFQWTVFCQTLHNDPSILGGPTRHSSV